MRARKKTVTEQQTDCQDIRDCVLSGRTEAHVPPRPPGGAEDGKLVVEGGQTPRLPAPRRRQRGHGGGADVKEVPFVLRFQKTAVLELTDNDNKRSGIPPGDSDGFSTQNLQSVGKICGDLQSRIGVRKIRDSPSSKHTTNAGRRCLEKPNAGAPVPILWEWTMVMVVS